MCNVHPMLQHSYLMIGWHQRRGRKSSDGEWKHISVFAGAGEYTSPRVCRRKMRFTEYIRINTVTLLLCPICAYISGLFSPGWKQCTFQLLKLFQHLKCLHSQQKNRFYYRNTFTVISHSVRHRIMPLFSTCDPISA